MKVITYWENEHPVFKGVSIWFTHSTVQSPAFQGGVEGAAQGEPQAGPGL